MANVAIQWDDSSRDACRALHVPLVQTVQNLAEAVFTLHPRRSFSMEREEAEARLSAIPHKWAN